MRRPRGEAAQKILLAFAAIQARELSLRELEALTGLSGTTLTDNVKALVRQGKVETYRDNGNVMWVQLAD